MRSQNTKTHRIYRLKPHTKIYLDYFKLTVADWIGCEICGKTAKDLHHIEARGMGGDPQGKKDVIENLMALCRECHVLYGDDPKQLEFLKDIHSKILAK